MIPRLKNHKKIERMEKEFRSKNIHGFRQHWADLKKEWAISEKTRADLGPEARRIINELEDMTTRVLGKEPPSVFLDELLLDSAWGHFFDHASLLHAALLHENINLADHLKMFDGVHRTSPMQYRQHCERFLRRDPFSFFTALEKRKSLAWLARYQRPPPRIIQLCFLESLTHPRTPLIDFWLEQGASPELELEVLNQKKSILVMDDDDHLKIRLEKIILSRTMPPNTPPSSTRKRM